MCTFFQTLPLLLFSNFQNFFLISYQDHVGEILSKWDQIDDEIWAKVVVMERNRRVAKAYARTPVLTIAGGGGSSTNKSSSPSSPSSPSTNLVGFNGHRVTLGAFANAHRDRTVRAAIRAAGDGLLVRMDEEGNLLGKRSSERSEVSLLQNSDLKQQQKPAKISAKNSVLLFDMAAFRSALEKEVLGGGKGVRRSFQTSSSPSTLEKVRAALQAQCFVFLGFGNGFSANSSSNSSSSLLRTPVWAILVNLVALEMLFSSLPSPLFHHLSHQTTENFYSLPAMTSGNSKDRFSNKQKQQQKPLQKSKQSPQQQQKMSFMNASFSSASSSIPPKLPPRDLQHAKPPLTLPEPDYDEEEEEDDNFSHQRSVDDMAELLLSKNSKNKNNYYSSSAQGLAKKPQQQQPYNGKLKNFLQKNLILKSIFYQMKTSTS